MGAEGPPDLQQPAGSRKKELRIITQINKAIDATPAGGEIRMAQYLFDLGSVARKLVAAHRRGVSVQVLIDDGENNKHIRKVRRALGTNKKARSFVATCSHSCMSNGTSVIHAKFYLFSVAGKARYVSMISSANPYTGNTYNSWNNNHTIVGDTTIYDSLIAVLHRHARRQEEPQLLPGHQERQVHDLPLSAGGPPARGHRDDEGAQPDLVQDHRQGLRDARAGRSSGSPTGVGVRPGWTSPSGSGSCTTAGARSR